MSVLFPFLPFDPVETPLSFATRLASFHLRSSVVTFLHDIGVRPDAMIGCEEEAVARLAALAGVDAGALHHNAARRIGQRRFDLRGHELSSEFFCSPDTVFCPACLREDDGDAADVDSIRRGRLEWTLRPVRTCPRHAIVLVHRDRQKWDDIYHELGRRVPERGADLDLLIDGADQRAPSPMQDYVLARLDGVAGGAWLDSQTLEQAVRSTEMVGLLAEYGPTKKPSDLSLTEWDQAGATGFAITSAGEGAIREALRDVQANAARNPGKVGGRKVLGALYDWLSAGRTAKEPGDIKRILREHMIETMAIAPGETILGETITERRFHSVESLAAESGLNSRTLRSVLAAKGLVPLEETVSGYHVFDAELGRKLAASVQRRTHVSALGNALNCTRPQANQLLDERLLVQISDGAGAAVGRTRKAVDNQEIARFLAALHADARPVDIVPVGMVPISKAAEKAKCPSVAVVHFILCGFLENVARLSGVEGYAAILVDPEEVRAQVSTVMTGLSASEAFVRLKIPKSTGWALVLGEEGHGLQPKVIEGKNGRHRIYRFAEEVVAEFMSEFITPAQLATDHDLHIGIVINRLKRSRIRPVMPRREFGVDFYRAAEIPELKAA